MQFGRKKSGEKVGGGEAKERGQQYEVRRDKKKKNRKKEKRKKGRKKKRKQVKEQKK